MTNFFVTKNTFCCSAGRVAKWDTILGAFDIKYMPRTSIKGQVLADLVAEFTEHPVEELKPAENMNGKLVGTISQHGPSLEKCMLMGHRIRTILEWG